MPFVVLGLTVGGLSGILGLGGGLLLVPALILFFHFTPPQAQGTSLAVLIPPIGLFAALEYYRKGLIEFRVVGLICLGFLVGAYLGALVVDRVPVTLLRRVLGVVLLAIALYMVCPISADALAAFAWRPWARGCSRSAPCATMLGVTAEVAAGATAARDAKESSRYRSPIRTFATGDGTRGAQRERIPHE